MNDCLRCSKEKEITEMHTDIKWIKKKMDSIDKSIHGNGQKGLLQRIEGLENWRYYMVGAIAVVSATVSLIIKFIK